MEVETASLSAGEIAAIAHRIDRPLVLVGLMGCGKSTLGRRLAHVLGFGFVDADEEIERAAQMTISEIFASYGEAGFRDGERRVIARLIEESGSRKVIATGGGAFVDPHTRALIRERAITIWLDCDVDSLLERTSRRDNRPLLKQGNPRETLERLLRERGPAYAEAHLRVPSGAGSHQRTLGAILKALHEWL
jgi:shikimate kinase